MAKKLGPKCVILLSSSPKSVPHCAKTNDVLLIQLISRGTELPNSLIRRSRLRHCSWEVFEISFLHLRAHSVTLADHIDRQHHKSIYGRSAFSPR